MMGAKEFAVRAMVLGAVVALLAAACGGGEPTATPLPPTATPRPAATSTPAAQPSAGATTARPTATPAPTTPPATPTPTGPQPKYGGTFTMRSISDWQPWDLRHATGQFGALVWQNVLGNIITYKPDDAGDLRGDLAQTWSISPDGTVWTFALRRDVTWHYGRPFTAKDVAFTLDAFRNPSLPDAGAHRTRLAVMDKVEQPDEFTVRVTLKGPSASFLAAISIPSLLVYPAHLPDIRAQWSATPTGTGPFTFAKYTKDVSLEFARNPSYYKRDGAGGKLPYLDKVQYYIIADIETLRGAFTAGRIDCLCGYGSDLLVPQVDSVKQRVPGAKVSIARSSSLTAIVFNSRPPFDNQKLRQAIHAGIDRKEINQGFVLGTGYYPPGLLAPQGGGGQWALADKDVLGMPGFREPKEQDRALARQLLRDGGIDPSGISVNILLQRFPEWGELLDAELSKLGFKRSKITVADTAQSNAELARGNFDIHLLPFGASFDDPADQLSASIVTGGARNFGKFSFPEIDRIVKEQDTITDVAKRKAVLQDLQRKLYDLAYVVPFLYQAVAFAAQPYVEGFSLGRVFVVTPAHRLDTVWVNR